ncbi:MAG: hypothetical protein WCA08_25410, partial [Desulfoferrobacter sp.]
HPCCIVQLSASLLGFIAFNPTIYVFEVGVAFCLQGYSKDLKSLDRLFACLFGLMLHCRDYKLK